MASNLLTSQWRESDIAALFDSGHVHAGNVRGLVVHMRAQRQSIKADQTIYYYTRLRRDHILMNGGEYGEPLGSSDTTALSSSSSSTKAKEKEKEKDALSNPTHIALAEYLRKSLLKDKPLVCAVFRYADQFLGREEEVFAPSDRKAHTTHKGNAVLRKIPIQVPSSGLPVASSSSCFNDRLVGTAAGSGSAGSNSNNTLNMNHIDSNRTCSSSSNSNGNGNGNGSGTGGFTNGTEVNMDGTHGSSNIGVRNPKRPVPILSPLGVINENPPPVDMSQFLKIFLNKSDATSIKRSRAV